MRLSDASLDDFRARNPVAEVVARLGVQLRRSGRWMVGAFPICGGDLRHSGRFAAPAGITEAIILGDGDSDRSTTSAAVTRPARRLAAQGMDARIAWALKGRDMNDILRPGI